jgi:hypothetical protein
MILVAAAEMRPMCDQLERTLLCKVCFRRRLHIVTGICIVDTPTSYKYALDQLSANYVDHKLFVLR